MTNKIYKLMTLLIILSIALPMSMITPGSKVNAAPPTPVTFTILHNNDFHGQLEPSGSNPGLARVANTVNNVRTAVGAGNVLLVDGGDEMQGSLLSNLYHGEPVIASYNEMGYNAATFGNHEFDWGQDWVITNTTIANYPYVSANIVVNDTGDCATAGWTSPAFAQPYSISTVGTPTSVKVGFIGVTTQETPSITIAEATAGLCFKDPKDSILHYYDQMKADGADVIVVLSHLGFNDGGYGYGFAIYGDKSLAQKLNDAGKPVNLIIGGHSHSNLWPLSDVDPTHTKIAVVGNTTITQAYYNGRVLGRADITVQTDGAVSVAWQRLAIGTSDPQDPAVLAIITQYSNDPWYQALVNLPIGYSAVDLPRRDGKYDNMMGTFVDDAIYNYLNTDADPTNDIDIFFNNAGGIRTDWCWNGSDWINTGCVSGTLHAPGLLTYGDMFTILPFGNATVVGDMTGAQILEVLNKGPQVSGGVIQPAGINYSYYAYKDSNPGPQPYAWGAFDYCVVNKVTKDCEALDLAKTYRVGTNEFLAPSGGDGYGGFKYMTNISYWGDMLNAVDAYVSAHYGTPETAYKGPNGDGSLDFRIIRDGTDAPDSGSIIPITILHHNDSHGNLVKGTYPGYTQLVTLIKQERLHNPTRTILLSGGDNIQGDAMSYYYTTSYSGFASDGTPLPVGLQTQPLIAAFNTMDYDAMDLGNHEFNWGSDVFKGVMGQAEFPILGANVTDDGRYGLSEAQDGEGVQPYILKNLGGISIAILGITNHRVPNYELPSNILGLTFSNPIETAAADVPGLRENNDVVIALTHIGFTTNPKSVEVDSNVDTNLAAQVAGIDAIIGSHSHTNPASPETPYKQLPTYVSSPTNTPVLINQAYRYNNTLGEVILGMRRLTIESNRFEVVSRVGQYITVATSTPEDPATVALLAPYVTQLAAYNNQVIGQTTVPIDALQAFTQETNAANLQADAAVFELAKYGITDVDIHLSGAMTNKAVATVGPYPVTLKVSDMFTLMPYENSLVVLSMNGPQIKAVLERGYRNYYYYKYVPGYGGYSYYTTCMLDTNSIGQIVYKDTYPALPNGQNVAALLINDVPVDFTDASKYYNVSTVNYLAAGSCNFNNSGVSLWPLNQIVHDTQYYVRDSVIDYITAMGTVSPAIEGRLVFFNPFNNFLPSVHK
jgi:2',3'-cyclic-nucleotide 2'-phosphodiesterase (5'-nucleotidase family)